MPSWRWTPGCACCIPKSVIYVLRGQGDDSLLVQFDLKTGEVNWKLEMSNINYRWFNRQPTVGVDVTSALDTDSKGNAYFMYSTENVSGYSFHRGAGVIKINHDGSVGFNVQTGSDAPNQWNSRGFLKIDEEDNIFVVQAVNDDDNRGVVKLDTDGNVIFVYEHEELATEIREFSRKMSLNFDNEGNLWFAGQVGYSENFWKLGPNSIDKLEGYAKGGLHTLILNGDATYQVGKKTVGGDITVGKYLVQESSSGADVWTLRNKEFGEWELDIPHSGGDNSLAHMEIFDITKVSDLDYYVAGHTGAFVHLPFERINDPFVYGSTIYKITDVGDEGFITAGLRQSDLRVGGTLSQSGGTLSQSPTTKVEYIPSLGGVFFISRFAYLINQSGFHPTIDKFRDMAVGVLDDENNFIWSKSIQELQDEGIGRLDRGFVGVAIHER